MPGISVILPTYDRAAFLPQAVNSVLAQTHADWELLVVDDGSTDGTRAYLAGLTDPRVRVLLEPHSGNPARVRNVALRAARGRYAAFLDSDDWWEPEKLALQAAALAAHPECRWSYTGIRGVDLEGRELPVFARPPRIRASGMVLDGLVRGGAGVITSTLVVERALLEELGGFDETFVVGEDFDLWIQVAARSPAAGVARILATRRRHAGSYVMGHRHAAHEIERSFGMLVRRAPTPGVRRALAARRARWFARQADERRQTGDAGPALGLLRRGLPAGLTVGAWWLALGKALVQAVLPRSLRAAYRDLRSAGR